MRENHALQAQTPARVYELGPARESASTGHLREVHALCVNLTRRCFFPPQEGSRACALKCRRFSTSATSLSRIQPPLRHWIGSLKEGPDLIGVRGGSWADELRS